MIISTVQKYMIGGLLGFVLLNVSVIGYMKFTNNRLVNKLEQANKETEQANKIAASYLESLNKANKSNQDLRFEINTNKEIIEQRDAKIKELNDKKGKTNEQIKKIVIENPDWASSPVPDGLLDAFK